LKLTMKSKERINRIFEGKAADRCGFWLGNPADETKLIYGKKLGLINTDVELKNRTEQSILLASQDVGFDIELHKAFNSDLYWVCPHHTKNFYCHPEGKPVFDVLGGRERTSLTQAGVFAEVEDVKSIESFAWPDPDYVDLSETFRQIDQVHEMDMAVFSGMWAPFFHDLCDFFGMENYFMKMLTNSEVVQAATEKIMEFYLEINQRIFSQASEKISAVFFGNDLGSQYNPLIGPAEFKQFVLPFIKQIVEQAKHFNLKVVMHSCGSVSKFIPEFIDAGIDGLHPLQAKAQGMDAENLARQFQGDLVFVGGVDTQDLLPFDTAEHVRKEVTRLKDVFGDRFIVSPSHEALLPNVPVENSLAMSKAAR